MGALACARGDRRLHLVRTGRHRADAPVEHRQALGDRVAVPPRAVLLLERHEVAVSVDPGRPTRVVQQHQREQPTASGSSGISVNQHPRQPDRLLAELRAHEVGTGRRR